MKTFPETDRRAGVALLTVLGIVFALTMVLATVMLASLQRTFTAKKLADRMRASALAEAAAAQAYSVLVTNFALRTNPAAFAALSLGGGGSAVGVRPVGDRVAVISATGTYNSTMECAVLDVRNRADDAARRASFTNAFKYVMLAGGDIPFVGNMDLQTSNSSIHCNGAIVGTGQQTVRGNLSSSTSIDFPYVIGTGMAPTVEGHIGITVLTNVPRRTIPNILLDAYAARAVANSQCFNGTLSLSGNVAPPGGVMWVNGSISFGNGAYTGCFIATSNIEIKTTSTGTAEFRKVLQYPLLVSRDGDIVVKQAKMLRFNGLIYCKTGSFDKQGNGDVDGRGAIVTAGNISKNGGWSGMVFEDCTPIAPDGSDVNGDSGLTDDDVSVSAWQR